jgi:hypothetical protein
LKLGKLDQDRAWRALDRRAGLTRPSVSRTIALGRALGAPGQRRAGAPPAQAGGAWMPSILMSVFPKSRRSWRRVAASLGLAAAVGFAVWGIARGLGLEATVTRPKTVDYRHEGRFEYVMQPLPGALASPADVTPAEPVLLPAGQGYFLPLAESFEGSFSYRFVAARAPANVDTRIEVTAALSSPGVWSKTIPVLPTIAYQAGAPLTFTLDLGQVRDLLTSVEAETGTKAPYYTLNLSAHAHSLARWPDRQVEDDYYRLLSGRVEGNFLSFSTLTRSTERWPRAWPRRRCRRLPLTRSKP